MPQTSTRTLSYKRATFLNGDPDLQRLLTAALRRRRAVGERMEELHPEDRTRRFINTHRSQLGMLFGNLLIYSPNRNQALLTVAPDADELDVRQVAPPEVDGQRTEFLESILYFGVRGNHVVLLQSTALRARAFEAYLNWLLGMQTNLLDGENGVFLADEPSNQVREQVRARGAKLARLTLPLETQSEAQEIDASATRREMTRFQPVGRAFDVLSDLLGRNWFTDLDLSDSLDDSRLKVVVEVTYDRRTTDTGQDFLDSIAMSFRHLDEDEAEIRFKRGGKLKGSDLKIYGPVSVVTYGGLVDQSDLFPKMHNWLMEKFEQGVLSA